MLLSDYRPYSRITNNVRNPFLRIVGIYWHISTTGLQNPKHRHDQIKPPFHTDGYQRVWANPGANQEMSKLIGLSIEFCVAQAPITKLDGQRVWRSRHL